MPESWRATGQFDDLLGAGQRIDGGAQDVSLHVLVEFAAALLQIDQLGLGLKRVEQDHATILGQTQTWRHMRRPGFVGLALAANSLSRAAASGAGLPAPRSFSNLLGGRPIDQRVGDLFPFVALRTQVAHAIAFDLPFCASSCM